MLAACGAPPQASPTQAVSGGPTPAPAAGEPTAAGVPTGIAPAGTPPPPPASFQESPALAQLVEAGNLPPVAERLPKTPFVVTPTVLVSTDEFQSRPGTYGGTLQLAQEAPSGDPIIFIGMNEGLLWAPSGFDYSQGIQGNVVEGYEANEDDTEFTFHMREGLRWSDGEPVTMEDVTFAFEDVLYNEEITPIFPSYLRVGARSDTAPARFKAVDDLTFTLTFDGPYGSFPAQLAINSWRGYAGIIKPKHYLRRFHTKYTPLAELRPLMKEESIPEDQWFTLFNARQLTEWMWNITNEQGIGHPTLTAWVIRSVRSGVFTFERNPYYFKVDSAGNQLPYMDGIRSDVVQDKEALTARALMGEFDYLGERASMRKLPLIVERAEGGGIAPFVPRQHVSPTTVFLNLTYADKNWRKVVQDIRFRRALSLATDRQELIESFYLGEFAGPPKQTNPSEYDVEQANTLLDEIGLDKKDAQGFRLGPDGKRFRIHFEVVDATESHVPVAELMTEYWKNVGIYTTLRTIDGTLFGERASANKLQATVMWTHVPIWRMAANNDYLPSDFSGSLWATWYNSQGKEGEEPPEEIKQLYENHGKFMSATIGSAESNAAMDAIMKSHRDNIWLVQLFEDAYWPTFFTSRIKNVPSGIKKDVFGIIVTYSMEQWYIEA
jgi:peptide/nickel transport system substrate-binding protein